MQEKPIRSYQANPVTEFRRDQEEGRELDSHEEVKLSFAGPGEIKRMEVALDPQESPEESQSREDELGSENLTCLLLQLFHNSSTTDIVLVTLLRTVGKQQLRGTLVATQWRGPHCLNIVLVLAVVRDIQDT